MHIRANRRAVNNCIVIIPKARCYAFQLITPLLISTSLCAHGQTIAESAAPPKAPDVTVPSSISVDNQENIKLKKESNDENATPASVVVTASRRREPVREVPMQVNVLFGEQLEDFGARSLRDYISLQPGVTLNTFGGVGQGDLSIRGVTTGLPSISTVAAYVDDVAIGSSTAFVRGPITFFDMGLLDLNRVEILRGPQGTLYGASAMGGVLQYVTNVPNTEAFSGKVGVGMSSTRAGGLNHTINGVVNVPLQQDVAALRMSAYNDYKAGFVNAVGPAAGERVDQDRATGQRVSLLVTPSRALTIRLTATSQQMSSDGLDYVDYDVRTGQPVYGYLNRLLTVREPFNQKTDLYSANIEYDFGWARFNSITSSQSLKSDLVADRSNLYLRRLRGLGMNVAYVAQLQTTDLKKKSQEFRLVSKANQQFTWIGGLFYTHEDGSTYRNLFPVPNLSTTSQPSAYSELAGYGDVTWNFTPRFGLTAGMRIARNRQNYEQTSSGLLQGRASSVQAASSQVSKTYLLTSQFALTPDSNMYARIASGYRPGGPNAVSLNPTTGQPFAPPTFRSDTLWNYEAGYKARFLDKKLSIETAAYNIKWKNFLQGFLAAGIPVIINAGNARVRGLEFAANYKPTAQWDLSGNFAFIDAKLESDAPGLGATAGATLPKSPRFSSSLTGKYTFDVRGYRSYAGLTERYVGQRNAGWENSRILPSYMIPGYTVTDLQAGVDIGRISFAFFVRNVFDKQAQTSAFSDPASFGAPVQVTNLLPRAIGINMNVSF